MRIVILTNDNFFSYTVLSPFLKQYKDDIPLVIFSSALIGKRGTIASICWSVRKTGLRHTIFKLSVYGVFRFLKVICRLFPFVANHYSSHLWVQRHELPHIKAVDINGQEVFEKIRSTEPELIVSVSMNQIVKKPLLQMPPRGCINVHCAPLPRYAGMSPYVWALAENESHSAVTIHYMEEGLDEGDIIMQKKVPVKPKDSAFALFYRCCTEASRLLPQTVRSIEDNTVESYKQDLSQKTYFSWPDKACVRDLKRNGFKLARIQDFLTAIIKNRPRN